MIMRRKALPACVILNTHSLSFSTHALCHSQHTLFVILNTHSCHSRRRRESPAALCAAIRERHSLLLSFSTHTLVILAEGGNLPLGCVLHRSIRSFNGYISEDRISRAGQNLPFRKLFFEQHFV